VKKSKIKEIVEEFEYRYQWKNPALLKGIRKLLTTAAGVLLIAGQSEWLEERLKNE